MAAYDHIAWVPSKEESGKGGLFGLAFDKADNIYVGYKAGSKYDDGDLANPLHPACRDLTQTRSGVYKIDAKNANGDSLWRGIEWIVTYQGDRPSHANELQARAKVIGVKLAEETKGKIEAPLPSWSVLSDPVIEP